jgi:hypothetical protein
MPDQSVTQAQIHNVRFWPEADMPDHIISAMKQNNASLQRFEYDN